MFSFQTSADPPYIYDNTHYICSSTGVPHILIYTYSLYAMMNPVTFLKLPLNFCGLATLTCILGHMNIAISSASPNPTCIIIACSTTSCSCYCQTICSKLILCQLMVYGSSGVVGDNADDGDWLSESANLILDLLPDLYYDSNVFFCKG